MLCDSLVNYESLSLRSYKPETILNSIDNHESLSLRSYKPETILNSIDNGDETNLEAATAISSMTQYTESCNEYINKKELSLVRKSLYDCIVLDLDGTLVFASSKKKGIAESISFKDMHGDTMMMWLHKRPGFDLFLKKCFESAIVGVWSMGQSGYVEAVVSLFPQRPAFVYNWCHCDRDFRRPNGKIFKRLRNIPHEGKIIMIDDRTDVLEMCDRVNTYIVPEWHPRDKDDTTLYDLSPVLFC